MLNRRKFFERLAGVALFARFMPKPPESIESFSIGIASGGLKEIGFAEIARDTMFLPPRIIGYAMSAATAKGDVVEVNSIAAGGPLHAFKLEAGESFPVGTPLMSDGIGRVVAVPPEYIPPYMHTEDGFGFEIVDAEPDDDLDDGFE